MTLNRGVMDQRVNYIVAKVKGANVVHVGCADWPFTASRLESNRLLHSVLHEQCDRAVGIDISDQGLASIREIAPELEVFTPREFEEANLGIKFDWVVATEVLEHVPDLGEFLSRLHAYSKDENCRLLITVPNAYSMKGCLRAFMNREEQHPDHVALFSPKTISKLLEGAGWKVDEISYYWADSGAFVSRAVNQLVSMFQFAHRDRVADGLMVVARPMVNTISRKTASH